MLPTAFSLADVLLAYRQAKQAIVTEPGEVSRIDFARFELRLQMHAQDLLRSSNSGAWFEQIPIGRVIVTPRPANNPAPESPAVVRVGGRRDVRQAITVRLQLAPSPQFLTMEVLYLWKFGPLLDAILGPGCVGYRLNTNPQSGVIDRESRYIYKPWREAFERYRTRPLDAATRALANGERLTIVSTDIASFFDSVDPSFVQTEAFANRLGQIARARAMRFSKQEYLRGTSSLLRKFGEFRDLRHALGVVERPVGMPIGSLTSRVFANVALASLDAAIDNQEDGLNYQRYVDDIIVVSRRSSAGPSETRTEALRRVFPMAILSEDAVTIRVPQTGARFKLRLDKTRIHDLEGPAAIDFLRSIGSSFSAVASERRAFVGEIERLDDGFDSFQLSNIAEARDRPGIRSGDAGTLRRFAETAFTRNLEQSATLLSPTEAQRVVRRKTSKYRRIYAHGITLDDVDFALRLMRAALMCRCDDVAAELDLGLERMIASLRPSRIRSVVWRGEAVEVQRILRELRRYLRQRVVQLKATASPLTRVGPGTEARLLRSADLRYLDREDDHIVFGYRARPSQVKGSRDVAIRELLADDRKITSRLDCIKDFLDIARSLDGAWENMSEIDLLVSVQPPKYADVSLRFLARRASIASGQIGTRIIRSVNALRGTRYYEARALEVESDEPGCRVVKLSREREPEVVRVILCNLSVAQGDFEAAAQGSPNETERRFRALGAALRLARNAAHKAGGPSVILLPELSVPRKWLRSLTRFAHSNELSIVAGLEYRRDDRGVTNQAVGIFATGRQTGEVIRWTKCNPARGEEQLLRRMRPPQNFAKHLPRRTVVDSGIGRVSVLICSELLETAALNPLLGKIEVLFVPAWNTDTSSFDYVGHATAGLLLHSFVAIANNSEASDSRVIAPVSSPRHEREWCRLVHRGEDAVVWADLPVAELQFYHRSATHSGIHRTFRPLPPGV